MAHAAGCSATLHPRINFDRSLNHASIKTTQVTRVYHHPSIPQACILTMEDPISIPGAFFTDRCSSPARARLSNTQARPLLHIPPQSPSAASSLTTSFHAHPHASTRRKRPRLDRAESSRDIDRPLNPQEQVTASFTSCCDLESPAAFVNTSYRIAGGLDTPTAALSSAYGEGDTGTPLDCRPSRFTGSRTRQQDGYFPCTPDVLSKERNSRKRAYASSPQQGWGTTVYHVAGKVINFCTGAFRGFRAGGGQGYDMDCATPVMVEGSFAPQWQEKKDVFNGLYEGRHYRGSTPVPGEFPKEDFIDNYMLQPESFQATFQAAPILPPDYGGGAKLQYLDGSWVKINRGDADSRESSPTRATRKLPRPSTASQARLLPRGSLGTRSRLAPCTRSRSSIASVAGAGYHGAAASYASPRARITNDNVENVRPNSRHGRSQSSPNRASAPPSPDVQKFERKLRKQDKAQAQSISRLNQQAQDMIREATAALGTRIDIEDEGEMEDEGYGEGTEWMGESKW